MNALAACCRFSIFIGSFLYQRARPPQGIVLFTNLLGKGLTPRACMGDAGSISWVPGVAQQLTVHQTLKWDLTGGLFPCDGCSFSYLIIKVIAHCGLRGSCPFGTLLEVFLD